MTAQPVRRRTRTASRCGCTQQRKASPTKSAQRWDVVLGRYVTTRGSWWPAWRECLRKHSGPVQPPRMGLSGEAVYDAPGSYVQEK